MICRHIYTQLFTKYCVISVCRLRAYTCSPVISMRISRTLFANLFMNIIIELVRELSSRVLKFSSFTTRTLNYIYFRLIYKSSRYLTKFYRTDHRTIRERIDWFRTLYNTIQWNHNFQGYILETRLFILLFILFEMHYIILIDFPKSIPFKINILGNIRQNWVKKIVKKWYAVSNVVLLIYLIII